MGQICLLEDASLEAPIFSVRHETHAPSSALISRLLEGGSPEPPKRCVRKRTLQRRRICFSACQETRPPVKRPSPTRDDATNDSF